ncbi:cystathionine beta-lyase [Ponticoccus alexandrii]|uniref:Cystathionine beta-lyase n=1 Tax=Ponticoccus alexandrii TaxID=1943633 RepID=A0ABX7FBL2_9RHOB|nr:cystathionine beta-lyase [Ponticoccus alexandrii]ETA49335.1 cystathionine beta-lyase [Rhodobacteraceae bacterium PD-2]QRF67768.1 cystathionine beta-lyase [Ponticoccus alexandrii]
MKRETKLAHYGRTATPGPANPPIVKASTILHDTVASYKATKAAREIDDAVLSYGRRGTTTAHQLAAALADLEGGEACFLFPTGVAAVAGALTPYLGAGDHLLVVDTIFPATRSYCEKSLKRNGVSVDYIPWDTTDLTPYVKPETKLVMVESPASQTYEVMDLPALCASAHAHDLLVAADNTYGSGWLYRPLEMGCDLSVVAGTKYIGGHADAMMGAVIAKGRAVGPLRAHTAMSGQTLGPDEAYACLRGLRTLGLRLERHEANGLALAQWFLDQPEVAKVHHPALPDHPGHVIWQRDASGSNGLFTVEFEAGFDAEGFVDRLALFSIGSSWGGFESLAMPSSPDAGRLFPETRAGAMIRFHAGLEHIDDLVADLTASFDTARGR